MDAAEVQRLRDDFKAMQDELKGFRDAAAALPVGAGVGGITAGDPATPMRAAVPGKE